VFNLVLPAAPALLVRRRIRPLLQAADEDRRPSRPDHRRASAPLGEPQH
jgi:hypothetical protein